MVKYNIFIVIVIVIKASNVELYGDIKCNRTGLTRIMNMLDIEITLNQSHAKCFKHGTPSHLNYIQVLCYRHHKIYMNHVINLVYYA